jgi:hypothetical protein
MNVRLEVFTVVKIHVMVLWVVTLCSNVVGYQHFKELCHLQLQHPEDGGSMALGNTGILQHYMLLQPRRL